MTNCVCDIAVEGLAQDYPAGAWIAPHQHEAHQIIHAVSGVMRIVSDQAVWVTPPGRAVWMPARHTHAIRCATAVSMRTLYLRGAALDALRECQVWAIVPLMREILVRLATDPDPKGRAHLLALLLLEIETVDTLPLALPTPNDPGLQRIAEAIVTAPADDRPLSAWAQMISVGERTLIRRFLAETGMTFRQWRRQARLLAALEQLGAGASVSAAAFDVGYASASAFIAAFREAFGCAPGRYFEETGAPEKAPPD